MNIEKAIEILTHMLARVTTEEEQIEAVRLGVEALEYAARDRRGLSDAEIELLPGETK